MAEKLTLAEAMVYAAAFVKTRSFDQAYGAVMNLRCENLPADWEARAGAMAVEFRSFTLDGKGE